MIDRIATGGMGVVWLARDERLQRPVAIKQLLLQPGLAEGEAEAVRRRALREAQIAARLAHPNAITMYDVTQHVDDAAHQAQPCLVMEYLPSRSLATVLAEGGPLPWAEVTAIGSQIAAALEAAHASQIVHRDIKPGNILLADSGAAKITDFGISRASGDATITQTGLVAGTPAYLAPEVARGEEPTYASDVFSLGATLYAAVEGRGPFGPEDNQLALLHTAAAGAVDPPEHAGPLQPALDWALAPDPEARPTMEQLRAALARVNQKPTTPTVSSPPAAARPAAATGGPPKQPRRRRVPTKVTALVTAGVAALALGGFAAAAAFDQAGEQQVAATPEHADPSQAQRSRTPSPEPEPPERTTIPVDLSSGPIAFTPAGQLVIDYFARAPQSGEAWSMLTPRAQSAFGSRSAFRDYWNQYAQVWARNAYGLTRNPDGSVNVPVDVEYVTAHGSRTEHKVVRVTRRNGQLLIAEPAR